MTTKSYRPSPAAEVSVRKDGARWTLVFVRELRHPPESVWTSLTDPGELREWAPFDADRDLGSVGPATLSMAGGPEPERLPAAVRRAERPTLLEYTWGEDVLRWRLEPTPKGTRLTLEHTTEDKSWLPKTAAGWHICLDVAELRLSGEPVGRIVAGEAKEYGWEALNDAYAETLGIPSMGSPEQGDKGAPPSAG